VTDGDTLGVFGLRERIGREEAERLRSALTARWSAAHHRPPGGLRPDLDAHKTFFDPVAQGKRLRRILLTVDPDPVEDRAALPLAFDIDGTRALITPEGRIALDLLVRALADPGDPVRIDTRLAVRLERDLLNLYRAWGRHRLVDTIDNLGGGSRPLQVPAMGAALTLLVNRSDTPQRAIRRFGGTDERDENHLTDDELRRLRDERTGRDVVDRAFFACADAFTREITGSRRRSQQKERLISGWTLHEITRRLPDALVIDDDVVYVIAEHRGRLLDLVAAELKRRTMNDAGQVADAFDALVRAFGEHAAELAGYGLLFERASETARLRADLLTRWPPLGS
jgi:hypothetical protein